MLGAVTQINKYLGRGAHPITYSSLFSAVYGSTFGKLKTVPHLPQETVSLLVSLLVEDLGPFVKYLQSLSGYRGILGHCPRWLSNKESARNAGDSGNTGSTPGSGRSPGEGNGNPLQYSCLENPVDRGAWWATDHGVAKS